MPNQGDYIMLKEKPPSLLADLMRNIATIGTQTFILPALVALTMLLPVLLSIPVTAAPAATRLVDKSDPACSDSSGAPYCTIQAAVDSAVDGDEIQISADLYQENVQIPAGLIVSLSGAGGSTTAVDGNNIDSVFTINSGAVVTLTDMLITNGATSSFGGGIQAWEAVVVIERSLISQNGADFGGGVGNYQGEITLRDSEVTFNYTPLQGGGIDNYGGSLLIENSLVTGNSANHLGGGIANFLGTLLIDNSLVTGNTARLLGGGIADLGSSGETTILNSIVSGNTAGTGGGIYTIGETLLLVESELDHNQADYYGGGAYLAGPTAEFRDVTLRHNEALIGAGVVIEGGDLHIVGNEVGHNKASQSGAGIYAFAYAQVTVEHSLIYENEGGKGAGLSNDTNSAFILRNSTVRDNLAVLDDGGGIYNKGAFTAYDSTLSGNSGVAGGAVFNTGPGVFTAYNLTIALNDAFNGGGLHLTEGAEAHFYNTILAANIGWIAPDCYALGSTGVYSYGHNVVGDNGSCTVFVDGGNGDQAGSEATPLNPGLLSLADNGGYSLPSGGAPETHALAENSPALDAANPAHCRPTDQRGQSRNNQDGNGDGGADGDPCNAGAYEAIVTYFLYLPVVIAP
jgi:hypothetical protein